MKKWVKWGVILPTATIGTGGAVVAGLAVAGVFRQADSPTNLSDIFGTGFVWGADGSTTEGSSKDNPITATPTNHIFVARINEWLTFHSKTEYQDVVNDLTFTVELIDGAEHKIDVGVRQGTTSYSGTFTITKVYIDTSTGSLDNDLQNKIVDFSQTKVETTTGDVIKELGRTNTNLREDLIEITTPDFTDLNDKIDKEEAKNLWFSIDNNEYGYKFNIAGKANSEYATQGTEIFVKLKRTDYPTSSPQTWTREFYTTPTTRQLNDEFRINNSTLPDAFYSDSPIDNFSWTLNGSQATLTYGDANRTYSSGTTTINLNIDVAQEIDGLFADNDGNNKISTDTSTNNHPLIFINAPDSTLTNLPQTYTDTIVLLENKYSSSSYSNFRALDFTSMEIKSSGDITSTAGKTKGYRGTIKISAISGSTIYSGSVTITWQTYDYDDNEPQP